MGLEIPFFVAFLARGKSTTGNWIVAVVQFLLTYFPWGVLIKFVASVPAF